MGGGIGGVSAVRVAISWNRTEWHCAGPCFMCACISEALRNSYEAGRIAELVETARRTVKPHQCSCGIDCLRGEDHDECAAVAIVEIEPVDKLGETLAILDNLATYDICPQKGKSSRAGAFVLYYREPWHIDGPKRKYPVLVQHRCRKVAA